MFFGLDWYWYIPAVIVACYYWAKREHERDLERWAIESAQRVAAQDAEKAKEAAEETLALMKELARKQAEQETQKRLASGDAGADLPTVNMEN